MSHQDYLKECDEDQTRCLMELCQQKLAAIRAEGWQNLWSVSDNCCVMKWFLEEDYLEAVEYVAELCRHECSIGGATDIHLELKRYRPSEVGELLK